MTTDEVLTPTPDYTGHSMGWAVSGYTSRPYWRWWARFDVYVVSGEAETWAEAVGAAKAAYAELEAR